MCGWSETGAYTNQQSQWKHDMTTKPETSGYPVSKQTMDFMIVLIQRMENHGTPPPRMMVIEGEKNTKGRLQNHGDVLNLGTSQSRPLLRFWNPMVGFAPASRSTTIVMENS